MKGNDIQKNLNDIQNRLLECTKMLADLKNVKIKFGKDYFKYDTDNIDLKKIIDDTASIVIQNDEVFVISEESLVSILKNVEDQLEYELDIYYKAIRNIKFNKISRGNLLREKIIWLKSEEKLKSFHNILIVNDLIKPIEFDKFAYHFDLNDGNLNELNVEENLYFIVWKSTQKELLLIFELLEKNGFIIKKFFKQPQNGFKVLTLNFLNKDENHLNNKSLIVLSDSLKNLPFDTKASAERMVKLI